jgi:hypothetical protein
MKNSKAAAMALGLIAMASTLGGDINSFGGLESSKKLPTKREETPEQKEQRLLKNGLRKFTYGLNYVIALNQKSADKKARKLGYIK